MSGIRVQSKVIFNHLGSIHVQYEMKARQVISETTALIKRDSKQSMRGPKHGRVYRRGAITRKYKMGGKAYQGMQAKGMRGTYNGSGQAKVTVGYKFHRASAPGEAPAVDFGKLVNSIDTGFKSKLTGLVFSTAVYAKRLELEMNRAFLRPAAEKHWPAFLAKMKGLLGG